MAEEQTSKNTRVQMYTTMEPLGAKNVTYKGLICVNKVRTRNFFQDIGTGLQCLVGGEIKNLTRLTALIRDELIEEAKAEAEKLGANAIVGIRMETNSIFEGTLDVVLYGTAVHFLT